MSAANVFVSQLYHLAERKGLDTKELLHRAGISEDEIDAPEVRVDTERLAVIVMSLWDELQDESMGISASPIPRGTFHMMGKLAVHEPNLGKALQIAIRFYRLVTRAFEMELCVDGETATLKFHMNSLNQDDQHLFGEINLMAWHRFASWLISENLTLNEVFFDYPTPQHVSEYSYLFPGKHRFNAKFEGFSFKTDFLERQIDQNPSALKAFIQRCPLELFIQPKTDFSISHDLQKILKKHLRQGFPVIEDAAETLHLTKRTLIRKLKEEGSSYQQIKDLVRRDRAIALLTRHKMPLSEIAEAVGFSDPAVFARAFKTWTGLSPREYRTNAAKSSSRPQELKGLNTSN